MRLASSAFAAACAVALLAARGVRAAEACPLEVAAEAPTASWTAAFSDARSRLERLEAPHDCAAVTVRLEPSGGAVIRFRTRSGREASRAVATPDELEPTLEALLVTLAPAPAAIEIPTRPSRNRAPDDHAEGASNRPHVLAIAVTTGARFAAVPGAFVAPEVRLEGLALAGLWTLGAHVQAAATHHALGEAPAGYVLATYAAGLGVGRRHRFDGFSLGYAARAELHVLAAEVPAPAASGSVTGALETWQPRLGATGYALVPLRDPLALATGIAFDEAIARFVGRGTAARGLPEYPRFAATAFVGVEVGLR